MRAASWDDIIALAPELGRELEAIRERVALDWYPYGTLTNLVYLTPLFRQAGVSFDAMAGSKPVLDAGAGDGDLAFLVERAGYEVHALDNPVFNQNGLRGLRKLKEDLGSGIVIGETDFDRPAEGAAGRYGLAFFLGVLYHLKNPLMALEWLAREADYCVLSTRVARLGGRGEQLEPAPVGYLLDDSELNEDWTNYWIFTPAGLRRLVRRAGWAVLESANVGDVEHSDPLGVEQRDERMFLLMKSRRALQNVELLEGWYPAEDERGWRWTGPVFSALARTPGGRDAGLTVSLKFFLPDYVMERMPKMTLWCEVEGAALPARTYTQSGDWVYRAELPAECVRDGLVRLRFRVEQPFEPPPPDVRKLGVIVASVDVS